MSARPPILPPSIGMLAMLGVFVLHFIKPIAMLFPYPINYMGLVLIAAGALINIIAERDLQRFGAPFDANGQASQLVEGGLYRFSRNPAYLGMILIAAGITVWVGSLSPWLVVLFLPPIMGKLYVCQEECALKDRFGSEYDQYCTKVPRWIRFSKADS
ncbi:isoprenylcysteine carboxylmethyltransferase family protein [Reinekea forsetii]|nr:isoprenylcysteine carboxylmethyltransferase family protein [Reinekea forsetii]